MKPAICHNKRRESDAPPGLSNGFGFSGLALGAKVRRPSGPAVSEAADNLRGTLAHSQPEYFQFPGGTNSALNRFCSPNRKFCFASQLLAAAGSTSAHDRITLSTEASRWT